MKLNWNRHSYAFRNARVNWSNPWYGILKKLYQPWGGQRVHCFLTFRCNLDCGYCTLKFADGEMPVSEELTLDEWKEILSNQFPRPIKEVILSGGEPMLMPYFSELVNWLLDEGKFVCIFSNLLTSNGLKVKPNVRYRIHATYHKSGNLDRFNKNLEKYSKKYRVNVDEIGGQPLVSGSWNKRYVDLSDTQYCIGFFYSPDGRLMTNFDTLTRQYAKKMIDFKGFSENRFRKERKELSLEQVPTSGI